MFKKPFKVKSNTQLKGSDRKKLRSDVLQQYPLLTEEILLMVIPNKEPAHQLKVLVQSGEIVIIYLIDRLPIVFEIDKVLYPTVYLLWSIPELLYTFTTHPELFPIITSGADLMLPGLVLPGGEGLHAYGKLEKGDRVAINLTNNKAPIAVGKAAHSSYDMYMCGKRGKCVQVLHYYGDHLSTYGTKLNFPELGPAFPTSAESDKPLMKEHSEEELNTIESLAEDVYELNLHVINPEEDKQTSDDKDSICISDTEAEDVLSADSPSSTVSMDELLKYCFVKSIRTTMKKVELPLLISNFYKLHMIPACPKGKSLDIKKSSYKKLSNFLDEMVKSGTIQLECMQKGVQSISKIDYNNELVRQFEDIFCNEEDESGLLVDTSKTNKSTVPEIIEKYSVSHAVLPLFGVYAYRKKEVVTASQVRKVISDYVNMNNLQNPGNKKEVVLDDTLRLVTKTPSDVDVLPWDQLVMKIFTQMGHCFKVERGGSEAPLAKGKLQPIDIQVGTRSGNKKVTLVNNLELFGINLTEFARECQHGVAASTTINTIPSAKSAQLQIQGNQVIFIGKILTEKYQIPKRYLRGLENAPKKRK